MNVMVMGKKERSRRTPHSAALTAASVLEILRGELPRLRKEHNVRSIGLFGSYVKGSQGAKSDIDILVEYEITPGMLRYLDLENDLSELLGCKVDLVLKDWLKPSIGSRILQEVQNV